ncbi:MAG: hypothetical protein ACK502_10955 [Alphaproteobacteria bacterium]
MTKQSATSPFIKTAFVAIILASTGISSASHAGDFLATMATSGLESLSLDTRVLDSEVRIVCKENDQDPQRKALVDDIERIKARIAELEPRIPYSRDTIKGLKDEIANLEGILQRQEAELHAFRMAPGSEVSHMSREQIQATFDKLNKEIEITENDISKRKRQIELVESNILLYQNELETLRHELIAAVEKLRVYDARKLIACADRR